MQEPWSGILHSSKFNGYVRAGVGQVESFAIATCAPASAYFDAVLAAGLERGGPTEFTAQLFFRCAGHMCCTVCLNCLHHAAVLVAQVNITGVAHSVMDCSDLLERRSHGILSWHLIGPRRLSRCNTSFLPSFREIWYGGLQLGIEAIRLSPRLLAKLAQYAVGKDACTKAVIKLLPELCQVPSRDMAYPRALFTTPHNPYGQQGRTPILGAMQPNVVSAFPCDGINTPMVSMGSMKADMCE